VARFLAEPLNLLFSPIAYFTDERLHSELRAIIKNIEHNRDFLKAADRSRVVGTAFHMLVLASLCLKHEGFDEEREWRLIYSPKRKPSSLVLPSIEVIDGVPQTVYKIPLDGDPTAGLAEIDLPHLLDRVIIGPTVFAWPMYEAFVAALTDAGVANAGSRVVVSGIPIRT
jgi:hypothetical protein